MKVGHTVAFLGKVVMRSTLLTKTDVERVWREVYGGTRCDNLSFIFAEKLEKLIAEKYTEKVQRIPNGCALADNRAYVERFRADVVTTIKLHGT